jgi:protein-disulfide isomerase
MIRSIVPVAALMLLISGIASGQSGSKKLAVVNGEVITEDQVRKAAAGELEKLDVRREGFLAENDRDQSTVLEEALNNILEDKLVTAEAKKRSISVDELLATEVDAKAVTPSDDAVTQFWTANQARINVPREQALPQIRMYLRDQDRDRVFAEFVGRLKKDHGVEVYFETPRTMIATEGHPALGGANAAVTIVEFSDFECPYCGQLFPTLKKIEATYKDKIRVVYIQFPLTNIHPHAEKAAEASLCANDQQHFWELHDAMFNDQDNLEVRDLKLKAAEQKLDLAQFTACLDGGKYLEAVRQDVIRGAKVGVSGTPALFINGRMLGGAHPFEEIAKVIDEELERAAAKK